jgi:hypothetical protein
MVSSPPACSAAPFELHLPPRVPRRVCPTNVRRRAARLAILGAVMVGAAAIVGAKAPKPGATTTARSTAAGEALKAPPPEWQFVQHAGIRLAIAAPEFDALPVMTEAWQHPSGSREDELAFGTFADRSAPHLRLIVRRAGDPDRLTPSLFVELARRAAQEGLAVTHQAPAEGLATKFGPTEIAAVGLADASERRCLAFRSLHAQEGLRLIGWLCGSELAPSGRDRLACILDRIELSEGSRDPALEALFLAVERRGEPCEARLQVTAAPDPPRRPAGPRGRTCGRAEAAHCGANGLLQPPRGPARGG